MAIPTELLSAALSFIVTVLVLSYLLGDNPLFRATVYIFVGLAAGYAAAVAWHQVIMPLLLQPIFSGVVFQNIFQSILHLFPLILGALLLTKISPRFANLGQASMAYLVGVGAAVAIGGAVFGTILPQVSATINGFSFQNTNPLFMILNGGLILVGVIGTLVYFHFGARQKKDGTVRRNAFLEIFSWIGRIYIAITFGVLFAGVYMAALTALIERMDSISGFFILLGQSF